MAYLGSDPFHVVSAAWFPAPHKITHNVLFLLEDRQQNKKEHIIQSCVQAPDIFVPSRISHNPLSANNGVALHQSNVIPSSFVTRTRGGRVGAGAGTSSSESPESDNTESNGNQERDETNLESNLSTSLIAPVFSTSNSFNSSASDAEFSDEEAVPATRTLTFDDSATEYDEASQAEEPRQEYEEGLEEDAFDVDGDEGEVHIEDESEVVMEGYQIGAVYELTDGFYIVGEDGELHPATEEQEAEIRLQMESSE